MASLVTTTVTGTLTTTDKLTVGGIDFGNPAIVINLNSNYISSIDYNPSSNRSTKLFKI